MSENNNRTPSQAEVRQIFHETYNVFYKKWINPDITYDPEAVIQEARELDNKFGHQDIVNITSLIMCIENERRMKARAGKQD